MFEEHVEEYLRLEGADEISAEDAAVDLADILCAQGIIPKGEVEINLAIAQLIDTINYARA